VDYYIWYSEDGPGRSAALLSPLLAVPNVTAHPLTASVPITVLLYDGPLLCGFNVAIKALTSVLSSSHNTPKKKHNFGLIFFKEKHIISKR